MKIFNKKYFVVLLAMVLLVSCSVNETPPPATVAPTEEPTEEPIPTATPEPASIWRGVWTTWSFEELTEIEIAFQVTGETLSAEFEPTPGDVHTVSAVISEDEMTAKGSWENSQGQSGSVAMRMLEGDNQFVGNLDGYLPLCGAKEGAEQPDPCVLNWGGEWKVWVGVDNQIGDFVYTQDGNTVSGTATYGPFSYLAKGEVIEDGYVITGTWKYGIFEAQMSDNMTQFRGNLSNEPICGARLGAEKPDPCLWDMEQGK